MRGSPTDGQSAGGREGMQCVERHHQVGLAGASPVDHLGCGPAVGGAPPLCLRVPPAVGSALALEDVQGIGGPRVGAAIAPGDDEQRRRGGTLDAGGRARRRAPRLRRPPHARSPRRTPASPRRCGATRGTTSGVRRPGGRSSSRRRATARRRSHRPAAPCGGPRRVPAGCTRRARCRGCSRASEAGRPRRVANASGCRRSSRAQAWRRVGTEPAVCLLPGQHRRHPRSGQHRRRVGQGVLAQQVSPREVCHRRFVRGRQLRAGRRRG
jgi:hypothetical protein